MSNLRNSVRLMGFLGNDPDVKAINDKKKVARVSIANVLRLGEVADF